MITALDRYLIRQIMGPLLMTLAVAALLLILERMLRLFDFVINEGGPVDIVFRMLANLTPHYMGLALPIGLFLGVLVAFRRLSMSSELDAITTSGTGLLRLMRPIMGLTIVLMIINILLTGWVQPISRYTYRGLVFDLRSGALGASIRVGEFAEFGDDVILRVEQSQKQGSELSGIFLEQKTRDGKITVTAETGGFFATEDQQIIILRLVNGMLVDLNESQNKPRILTFDQQDLTIKLPTSDEFRARGGEERELTLWELAERAGDFSIQEEKRLAIKGQYHWRLMHSLTFLIIPFLAVPMGITNKRTGTSTGIVVGLTLMIVYNELMEVMENLVAGGVSPWVSVWVLYLGFAIISGMFFAVSAFRVGGDPLHFINVAWRAISQPLKKAALALFGLDKS